MFGLPTPWISRTSMALSVVFAVACGDSGSAGEEQEESGEAASNSDSNGSESGTSSVGDGDGDPSGDGDPGDGDPDPTGGECQPHLEEDCMDPSLKCMPWSENPDRIPDEMRCCDLSDSPVSLGDRCEVFDYDGSCLDNCPDGSMCVLDRSDTLEGYCQTFCDAANPDSCPPDELCKPFFEMIEQAPTVPLCMARCDPLLQDCATHNRPGWSCLPESALAPSFLCMPPPESPKMEGEGCLLANDCAVGLACVPGSEVIGCDGLFFCCSRFCDLSEPDTCENGNVCVDLESDIPGLENVGVCADPV